MRKHYIKRFFLLGGIIIALALTANAIINKTTGSFAESAEYPESISIELASDKIFVDGNTIANIIVNPETAYSKNILYTSSDPEIAHIELDPVINITGNNLIHIYGHKPGTVTITAITPNDKTATATLTVEPKPVPTVTYSTHVQSIGDQTPVSNGAVAGTSGRALRLESIKINVSGLGMEGGIKYRTHVQTYGWQDYVLDGEMSGTTGQAKRLEAIEIELYGKAAQNYDIYYRVHAQKFGWMGWAKNGQSAGTEGFGYRLEGIQIVLVEKGGGMGYTSDIPPTNDDSDTSSPFEKAIIASYNTHVQGIGWQGYVSNGATAGTSGQAKRLEAIRIRLDPPYPGYNTSNRIALMYQTHVQTYGWQRIMFDDALSGTTGESKRLEAIRIQFYNGNLKNHYNIWYRVHAQKFGWMGWAKNGEPAGTAGYAYRLEAIEIKVLPKSHPAPGDTANAYISKE